MQTTGFFLVRLVRPRHECVDLDLIRPQTDRTNVKVLLRVGLRLLFFKANLSERGRFSTANLPRSAGCGWGGLVPFSLVRPVSSRRILALRANNTSVYLSVCLVVALLVLQVSTVGLPCALLVH